MKLLTEYLERAINLERLAVDKSALVPLAPSTTIRLPR